MRGISLSIVMAGIGRAGRYAVISTAVRTKAADEVEPGAVEIA